MDLAEIMAMRLVVVLLACVLHAGHGLRLPGAASQSRRQLLSSASAAGLAVALSPRPAFASLDPNDMTRFKKALDQINYLLNNWEKETQECVSSGNGICVDSPDKVRYYVGLRTTDHPLFQLDKLYAKAQTKLPDDVDFETWIDATEGLASQIAKINELAYTCVLRLSRSPLALGSPCD